MAAAADGGRILKLAEKEEAVDVGLGGRHPTKFTAGKGVRTATLLITGGDTTVSNGSDCVTALTEATRVGEYGAGWADACSACSQSPSSAKSGLAKGVSSSSTIRAAVLYAVAGWSGG